MQLPSASAPRKTLNPNVVLPGSVVVPVAPSSKSGLGASMRPPPVHLPLVHCWVPPQKLGLVGAGFRLVCSPQAATRSPAARRPPHVVGILSFDMTNPPASVACVLLIRLGGREGNRRARFFFRGNAEGAGDSAARCGVAASPSTLALGAVWRR